MTHKSSWLLGVVLVVMMLSIITIPVHAAPQVYAASISKITANLINLVGGYNNLAFTGYEVGGFRYTPNADQYIRQYVAGCMSDCPDNVSLYYHTNSSLIYTALLNVTSGGVYFFEFPDVFLQAGVEYRFVAISDTINEYWYAIGSPIYPIATTSGSIIAPWG